MIIRMKSVTFRYRVGRIAHVSEPTELSDGTRLQPSVFVEDVREFRTLKLAHKYQNSLIGYTFIQYGVLQWLSGDEAISTIKEAQKNGAHLE